MEMKGVRMPVVDPTVQRVAVVDLDVSISNLVVFFLKAAVAAIPAAIIFVVVGSAVTIVLSQLLAVGSLLR